MELDLHGGMFCVHWVILAILVLPGKGEGDDHEKKQEHDNQVHSAFKVEVDS